MPFASDGQPLPQQSVTLFNDSFNKDKFENTALTINGRLGDLKAVYTGAYLVRNVSQVQDYTNYARGCVCGLLPVPWRGACERIGREVLFAEHHVERDRAQHPSES